MRKYLVGLDDEATIAVINGRRVSHERDDLDEQQSQEKRQARGTKGSNSQFKPPHPEKATQRGERREGLSVLQAS